MEITADQTKLTAGLDKAQSNVAASMKNIGRSMAIAGAAITAAFGYAVKGSMDFEAKLKRVEVQSGATASEMAEIKKTALNEEFVKLGKSGNQVADMYNRLASEGYDVAAMKKMLIPITEATIVLGTEEGETTKLMLNLMQQYNLTASDMGHISDVLAGALANTSFQGGELAEVMKYAGVAAGELGWSLQGTIPIVDAIIKVTGEASMAGTQFRMMIMKLRVPTETMKEEFSKVGITLDEVAEAIKTPIGLVELLSKAHEKGANFAAMFGARAGSAAAVIARQSVPAIEALTEKVNETGFAHEAAGGIMDTTAGKFATLGAAMQNIRTTIGDVLLPVVSLLADWIGKVAIAIKEWMEAHLGLTKAITLLGAALGVLVGVGGFVILGVIAFTKLKEALVIAKVAFIALQTAIKLLSGPIGWIILAVGALYLAWETNFGGIRDFTIKVVDKVKEALGWLWDKVKWVLEKLGLYKETAEEVTEANAELAIATEETGKKAGEAAIETDKLADSVEGLGEEAEEAGEKLDEFGNKIETFDEWVERLAGNTKTLAEATGELKDKILELTAPTEYRIKLLEDEAEAMREAGIAESLIVEWLEKSKQKLIENSDAVKKAADAKKRLADITKSLTDKIYEFTHTEEEVKLREINREYDILIENAKEVFTNYNELREAIEAINDARQKEIDKLKGLNKTKDEAIDKNKELIASSKEVTAVAEETGNAAETAAKKGIDSWADFTITIKRTSVALSSFTKEAIATAIALLKMKFFEKWGNINELISEAGYYSDMIIGQYENALETLNEQINTIMHGFDIYNETLIGLGNTTQDVTNEMTNSWNQVADAISNVTPPAPWEGVDWENVVAVEKGLGSYQHGTPYVPKTGLAIVHKGEEINPPGQRSYDNSQRNYSPTININNPIIRNDSDLTEIERMVNNALEKSARQYDRRGYELAPGMG